MRCNRMRHAMQSQTICKTRCNMRCNAAVAELAALQLNLSVEAKVVAQFLRDLDSVARTSSSLHVSEINASLAKWQVRSTAPLYRSAVAALCRTASHRCAAPSSRAVLFRAMPSSRAVLFRAMPPCRCAVHPCPIVMVNSSFGLAHSGQCTTVHSHSAVPFILHMRAYLGTQAAHAVLFL